MANFFLIDQSLQNAGGHHYDYVRCVATAARQAGYLTTIGAHQTFRDCRSLQPIGQIRKSFSQTTYQSDSYLAGLRRDGPVTENNYASGAPVSGLGLRKSIESLFKGARDKRRQTRRKRKIRNFAIDCERFFKSAMLTDQDHAFFATINEMEFMGLAAFLANHPRTIQATWHLQFDFNLFEGRAPEYQNQRHVAAKIQDCFDAALSRIPYHQLQFYTTSQTLADQFNYLGVGDFRMLAYPVRPELFETDHFADPTPEDGPLKRPLRLTCPDELRRDQGTIQRLQPVVDQIWDDHIQSGNLQLLAQRPAKKWVMIDQHELQPPTELPSGEQNLQYPWVEYFSQPIGDQEYLQLMRDTDCGLLFFDQQTQFSRRTGAMSELLSCGKPVIVPAGSWLGEQLAEPNFQHVDSLCNAKNRRRSLEIDEMTWSANNVPLPGNIVSFDQRQHPFEIEFELAADETAFAIEFDWHWPQSQGVFCQFEVLSDCQDSLRNRQIIGHRANGMSPVALFIVDQPKIRLRLTNAYHDSTASIRQLTVHTLAIDTKSTPQGSVGYIAAGEGEIGQAIDDIVVHYEHYLKTAKMFARNWCQQHQPRQTIFSLVDSGQQPELRRAA